MIRKGKPRRGWLDSVNVDLREKGLSAWRHKTGLCGGNLSDTSTPSRSGKRCLGRKKEEYYVFFYEVLNYFSAVIDSQSRVCTLLR